jgi:hypothetical protein
MSSAQANTRAGGLACRIGSLATSLPLVFMLLAALLFDALHLPANSTCRLLGPARPSWDPAHRSVERVNGVLKVLYTEDHGIGVAVISAREDDDPCFWASTSRTLRVTVSARTDDGSTVTALDLASIGNDVAAEIDFPGADPREVSLLRSGGGLVTQSLSNGYIHNIAAAMAAGILVLGIMRQSKKVYLRCLSESRAEAGQCPHCGYPTAGRPSRTCPECGKS